MGKTGKCACIFVLVVVLCACGRAGEEEEDAFVSCYVCVACVCVMCVEPTQTLHEDLAKHHPVRSPVL